MEDIVMEFEEKVIPGLPETSEEAISQIEEVECSPQTEWVPLEKVLDRIGRRYAVYAS